MKSIGRIFPMLVFSLLTAILLLPCPEVFAFRCGEGIVSVGDTKSRVLIECGKPTYRDRVGSKDTSSGDRSGKRKRSSKTVEQWSYNCGEGDFIYVLTFEGGKLTKEETNGRGRGKSRCQGPR